MNNMRKINRNPENINPYDCSRLGCGFNQPCPRCGKQIDRRTSAYEAIGAIDYCTCNRQKMKKYEIKPGLKVLPHKDKQDGQRTIRKRLLKKLINENEEE